MSRGLYYDEFEVGAIYKHAFTRTMTETDNILFSSTCMNLEPLHLDEEYAKKSIFGSRVFSGIFMIAMIGAFQVPELTQRTTLGNMGYDKVIFPKPVYHGDTVRGESEIVNKRLSSSRTDSGLVWFEHRGYNQHGDCILNMTRVGLMMTRPEGDTSVAPALLARQNDITASTTKGV